MMHCTLHTSFPVSPQRKKIDPLYFRVSFSGRLGRHAQQTLICIKSTIKALDKDVRYDQRELRIYLGIFFIFSVIKRDIPTINSKRCINE